MGDFQRGWWDGPNHRNRDVTGFSWRAIGLLALRKEAVRRAAVAIKNLLDAVAKDNRYRCSAGSGLIAERKLWSTSWSFPKDGFGLRG